jgi:sugar (pentulose or hexulose) kinase
VSSISKSRGRSKNEPLLLGIDLGTSYIKIALYDLALIKCDQLVTPTPVSGGGSRGQIDPNDLWRAMRSQISKIGKRVDLQRIVAIGITGMAESGCLIGAADEPLTPMLLWYDRRGTQQAATWRKQAGDSFARISGLPVTNVRSLAKWRWQVDSGAPREARWCGGPEWIALCLTGRWLTDSTLAVRTGAFDVLKDVYSRELLDIAGAPTGLFPPAGGSPALAGAVRSHVSYDLGLSPSVQVVVAGHDDIVAAYGAGARLGDLVDSGGTAEALVQITDSPPLPVRTFKAQLAMTRYYIPHSWALIAGAGATGALMQQVAQMLGAEPDRLDRDAAPSGAYAADIIKVRVSERGLPAVKLKPRAEPSEVWSAVLDLVSKRMARTASTLEHLAGRPGRALLIGGAARSRELASRKSRRLNLPVIQLPDIDATTRGAAHLAALASGYPVRPK